MSNETPHFFFCGSKLCENGSSRGGAQDFRLFGPSQSTRAGGVLLNVLEGTKDGPELTDEVAVISVVKIAKKGLHGLGSLVSLVERNATGDYMLASVFFFLGGGVVAS